MDEYDIKMCLKQ